MVVGERGFLLSFLSVRLEAGLLFFLFAPDEGVSKECNGPVDC